MGKGKGGSNTAGGNPNHAQPEVCLSFFHIFKYEFNEFGSEIAQIVFQNS